MATPASSSMDTLYNTPPTPSGQTPSEARAPTISFSLTTPPNAALTTPPSSAKQALPLPKP